jgi:hypothetical protein
LKKDRSKVYYISKQAKSNPAFNKSLTINKSFVSIMTNKAESATIGSCIIVGGGLAGIQVARGLQKLKGKGGKGGITVTVVDRQNYLDWSLASPRSVVAPDDVQKFGYVMPLTSVCEFVGADFVQGAVDKIGPKSVTLEDGTTLKADCVVVAIGGDWWPVYVRGHLEADTGPNNYGKTHRSLSSPQQEDCGCQIDCGGGCWTYRRGSRWRNQGCLSRHDRHYGGNPSS